jgi:hypothetical protein
MGILKPRRHPIEILGQLLEFIACIQVQTSVEVSGFQPRGTAAQRLNRPDNAPPEPHGRAHGQNAHNEEYPARTAERNQQRRIGLHQRALDQHRPSDAPNALV